MPAHPRVGGENTVRTSRTETFKGSSPRGRGKLGYNRDYGLYVRLIPAWAGKTAWTSAKSHLSPAHPRVGGENAFQAAKKVAARGSSPRGRGKPPALR